MTAAKALGIPVNDQATGNAIGGYFCPHNQDSAATRSSAREAYYASAAPRRNFHLIPGHQASRIVIDKSSGSAKVTGVEFAQSAGAERQSVKVKREAIVSAGSLKTPQLLQVSGVGDSKLLNSINVPVVVDLPAVGHNLHDHITTTVVYASKCTSNPNLINTNRNNSQYKFHYRQLGQ